MATIQGYTKTGVDRKLQARSPVTLPYSGTGTPELAAFPGAKTGDVIEREGDRARWRVVGNQIVSIAGGVTSVNGKVGGVTLTPTDVGAAPSSHTHTKAQITDLEVVSTSVTENHIVKRTTSGNISVPATPGSATSAASKSYVDTKIESVAASDHTHTKAQITDLEAISSTATANHIVKRTNAAQVEVPLVPTVESHAASKKYVDDTVINASVGVHKHDIADVRNLQTELDGKASSSHTHTKAQITDLEEISDNIVFNAIVKRTEDGNIIVPVIPIGPYSAVSKSYVDIEVGKRALSSHTHTKAQITDLETISTAATVNYLVKRTTSGNITVPTTPNAATSAASKSYVDTEVGKKANTSHTHTKAQITDLETISTAATVNYLVKRTTSGNITVPATPNASTSATSKKYVDDSIPWLGTRSQYNAITTNRLYIIKGA